MPVEGQYCIYYMLSIKVLNVLCPRSPWLFHLGILSKNYSSISGFTYFDMTVLTHLLIVWF